MSTLKHNHSLSYTFVSATLYHASSIVLESLKPPASDIYDTKKHYDQVLIFGTKLDFVIPWPYKKCLQTSCTDNHLSHT